MAYGVGHSGFGVASVLEDWRSVEEEEGLSDVTDDAVGDGMESAVIWASVTTWSRKEARSSWGTESHSMGPRELNAPCGPVISAERSDEEQEKMGGPGVSEGYKGKMLETNAHGSSDGVGARDFDKNPRQT